MSRATRLRTIKYKCVLKFAYAEKANAAVFINNSLEKGKTALLPFSLHLPIPRLTERVKQRH